MPLIPLPLPAGLNKNGTPYTRKNRWVDGNLVRHHDGAMRPIGGWLRRYLNSTFTEIPTLIADPTLEAVRDIFTWRENDESRNVVLGSNLALYHMDQLGVVTDVTYAGYAENPDADGKDAAVEQGYGENNYGIGAYGAGNNLSGVAAIPPSRWYFANFGEILLTGSRDNGGVYELDIPTLTLSLVTGAPTDVQALLVTDQRQVVAIGGGGITRRFQASDLEDRNDWTPAVANQAVDRVVAGTGKLLNIYKILNSILILGENDANVARYIGPPYVYSIDLVGESCGPIAAEATATTDRFAVWWGARNFWLFDGTLQKLECEVIDFLYNDIDPNQVLKICTFNNTDFSEVWWLYQSSSSTTTEVDSYVLWDYVANTWQTGRLDRTAGVDKGLLLTQIMVSSGGLIYNHELDNVIPSGEGNVFIKSGALDLGNGDRNMAVKYIYPDTEATTGVSFTLYGRQMPNATEYAYGPYAYQQNQPIPTRAIGREISVRVDFTAPLAELGTIRIDVVPMGTGGR
tara:strand:+ start:606 stop:2150 length:1545 start_codon:yes stop_codon:yes gene_type:complete